jgi:hypothetical protein
MVELSGFAGSEELIPIGGLFELTNVCRRETARVIVESTGT